MAVLFTNNATTTLASGITNIATIIPVAVGTGALFPTPTGTDVFYATLADGSNNIEIVKVTNRATDTFTVVRAQEGTTARAYLSGDKLELRPTAAGLNSKADKTGGVFTGPISVPASTGAGATFNIPHGLAPTAPVDGDIWTTTTSTNARINGATVTLSFSSATETLSNKSFNLASNIVTGTKAQFDIACSDDDFAYVSAVQTLSNKTLNSPVMTGVPTAPTAAGGTSTTQVATTEFVQALVASPIPSGAVFYFAMAAVPAGYLECNGAAVSRTTYALLFTAIGVTFGSGDGSTTFNLPEMRGEFIRGWDNGRGVDSGRTFGSFQADDLASHSHTIATNWGTGFSGTAVSTYATNGNPITKVTGNTGNTETRPRSKALLVCIKT